MARMSTIAGRAEALLGTSVVATTPVAGGDICTATRLRLSDGRSAFVKTRPHAPDGFFEVEAAGLRWLAEAGGAPVPDVLGVSDDCLILAWIEPGRPSLDGVEEFARRLSETHAVGAPQFGGERDGYVGTVPLTNSPTETWAEFWPTRRVLPYLKVARDRGNVSDDDAKAIETTMEQIADFAGPEEGPSRIHGDLWSGNVTWSSDGVGHLVDPAAHGGHRETDLAMLALFGAPHLSRLLEAYDEAAPLADGWRGRQPLHQLHPLLVHAILFGGSYGSRAGAAARSLLDGTAGAENA
jgi:fructosamine-3-kinase